MAFLYPRLFSKKVMLSILISIVTCHSDCDGLIVNKGSSREKLENPSPEPEVEMPVPETAQLSFRNPREHYFRNARLTTSDCRRIFEVGRCNAARELLRLVYGGFLRIGGNLPSENEWQSDLRTRRTS